MIVLRMWPTCIGLATFGEEKSMTKVRGDGAGSTPSRSSPASERTRDASQSLRSRTLMKPGPAISGGSVIAARSRRSTISLATSRGLRRSCLPSGMAQLA